MQLNRAGLIVAGALLFSVQNAQALQTVATFADPSNSSANPLFAFDGSFLTGGWSASNLDLITYVGGPALHHADATFTMTPLAVTSFNGTAYDLAGGQINFFDSASNPLLTISFSSGTLYGVLHSGFGFGGSDFWGQNVTFSGPILAGYTVSNERFGFSFTNDIPTTQGYTATSSFTSSADLVIPAPGAAAMLGLGGLMAGRRRR